MTKCKFSGILLLLTSIYLQSQVYLTENFESAFTGTPAAPPGWTQTRLVLIGDGSPEPIGTNGEKDWVQNTNLGAATWQYMALGTYPNAAVSGSNVLYINDYHFGGTTNAFGSRRMESPGVNLASSTSPYVRFWLFSGYTADRLFIRVVGSNDGGNTWKTLSFVNPNANVPTFSTTTPWQRINIKIPSDFKVANAKFGIEVTNTFGTQNVYIDDFSVEEFTPSTITSVASGGWNNPATWSGSTIPTSDHHVVIAAGHTVLVDFNVNRCQDLTVQGQLSYSTTTTTQLLHVMGNASIAPTGTLFSGNGTTGKRMYFSGDITNNGTMNFQPGTSVTGAIYWVGYQQNYSGTGSFVNNRVPVVIHAAGQGVSYSNTFTISNTCALYNGTVSASNIFLGGPPVSAINSMERYMGSFVGTPTFNNINVTSRSMTYVTPINNNGIFLALPQQVTVPGEEIPLISGSRQVTGNLTMLTHNNVQLNYPLVVGTATSGGLSLTRGIIQTTSVNLLTLNTNISGVLGTAPSTVTSSGTNGGTQGSYVDGPLKINFPATGTVNRIFALGKGFAFHTNLPSTNIRRPVTISAGGTAWNSQTITASIENAPSGTVNAPLTSVIGNLAYRIQYNGGPTLSTAAAITFSFENSTFAAYDNLSGDLADIRIAQAPSLGGTWTERSTTSGSGNILNNVLYGRTTATVAPGPINSDEYFAWASVGQLCSGTPPAGTISGSNNVCHGSAVTLTVSGITNSVGLSYQWAASTSSVGPFNTVGTNTVLNTGTLSATMYYIFTSSCSISSSSASSAVYAVTVNPSPNLTLTSSSSGYCGGANAPTLTASGASSFTWNPASSLSSSVGVNVIATPSVSTIYSVTGTSSLGCASSPFTIGISAVPSVSSVVVSSSSSSVCSGNSLTLSSQITNNLLSYCTSTVSDNTGGDYIESVVLSTLSNSLSGALTGTSYTLYPSTITTTLNAGSTYPLTLQVGNFSSSNYIAAFIDFNQNGFFSDPGEKIAQSGALSTNGVYSVNVLVPTGALNGTTRLRVREAYFTNNIQPCDDYLYGETEDYVITITGGANPTNSYTWTPSVNLTSPNSYSTNANNITSTTVYTLNVNNPFGCPGQGTVQVSVNPTPTITANSASVCSGGTAVITVTGATSYTWSNGSTTSSISVSPSVTTVYSVTGSDGTCTANQTATVTVYALPSVSLTAAQNSACVNGPTIQLTGTPSGGVYTGSNVTGSSFNPSTTGTFSPAYSYTDSNGCTNSATTTIIVNTCAGLNEYVNSGSIFIMPNPNNGDFMIVSMYESAEKIQIMDLSGRVIYNSAFNGQSEIRINMTGFSKGMYLLKVFGKDQKTESFRIILQ